VRANRGAPGIDRQAIADVEEYGITKLLDGLVADLKDGSYRTLPARRVFIPKPGRPQEQRPLSIPAVRDRVVQAAMKTVIEPIFEADGLPCSFGFRPRRAQDDALQIDAAAGGNQRQSGSHSHAVWAPPADPTRLRATFESVCFHTASALKYVNCDWDRGRTRNKLCDFTLAQRVKARQSRKHTRHGHARALPLQVVAPTKPHNIASVRPGADDDRYEGSHNYHEHPTADQTDDSIGMLNDGLLPTRADHVHGVVRRAWALAFDRSERHVPVVIRVTREKWVATVLG
jgi:hypothetical protein